MPMNGDAMNRTSKNPDVTTRLFARPPAYPLIRSIIRLLCAARCTLLAALILSLTHSLVIRCSFKLDAYDSFYSYVKRFMKILNSFSPPLTSGPVNDVADGRGGVSIDLPRVL